MRRSFIIPIIWLGLAGISHAQPVTGVDFTVTASLMPDSCGITISGGGVADFGNLSTAAVETWPLRPTPQPHYRSGGAGMVRTLQLNVDCLSPTRFALSVLDNRAASRYDPQDRFGFGLGVHQPPGAAPMNIGAYHVNIEKITVNGTAGSAAAAPALIFLTAGTAAAGSAWAVAGGSDAQFLAPGKSLAFAVNAAATTPDALTHVSAPLAFSFDLLRSTLEAASTTLRLDGAATVTFIGL